MTNLTQFDRHPEKKSLKPENHETTRWTPEKSPNDDWIRIEGCRGSSCACFGRGFDCDCGSCDFCCDLDFGFGFDCVICGAWDSCFGFVAFVRCFCCDHGCYRCDCDLGVLCRGFYSDCCEDSGFFGIRESSWKSCVSAKPVKSRQERFQNQRNRADRFQFSQ
jgi:hypothetical protein